MGAPILRPAAAAAASPPVTSHSAPTPVPPSLQPPASPSKPTQLLINAFKAINAIKSFRGSSVSFSRRDSKESPPPPKPVSFCHLVEFLCKRYSKDQNVHSIRQVSAFQRFSASLCSRAAWHATRERRYKVDAVRIATFRFVFYVQARCWRVAMFVTLTVVGRGADLLYDRFERGRHDCAR